MSPLQTSHHAWGSVCWPCYHGRPYDENQADGEAALVAEGSMAAFYQLALGWLEVGVETLVLR
jgi:hypothetical protein